MINSPHFPLRPASSGQIRHDSSGATPQPMVDASPAAKPPTIVVTIDGPAGAGKSTVARMLAERLGFEFLDTGAMYRCVTLATMLLQIDTSDERAVEELAEQLTIELSGSDVKMNGEDVSAAIRSPDVSVAIKAIADNVAVRRILSQLQRRWTDGRCVVTEGRDQGSEVFPDSPCKIFLVASCEERARRRERELQERGMPVDFQAILDQQNRRDQQDYSRPVGALKKAADAIEVNTDGKSLQDVVAELHATIAQQLRRAGIELEKLVQTKPRTAPSAPHSARSSEPRSSAEVNVAPQKGAEQSAALRDANTRAADDQTGHHSSMQSANADRRSEGGCA